MNEGKIKWFIFGFLVGFAAFCLCQRFYFGGFGTSADYNQASTATKQQYAEHHQTASELNSRTANYNKQLESGQRELDSLLREADSRIERAIKNYKEKAK